MWEIRLGLKAGVDVSQYADPKFNDWQMYKIRLRLKRKRTLKNLLMR